MFVSPFSHRSCNLSCPRCKRTFKTDEHLASHTCAPNNNTTNNRAYQCLKCQQLFNNEHDIQLHIEQHMLNEGNRHECRICDQVFQSPAKLQLHLIVHSFESIFLYICSRKYKLKPFFCRFLRLQLLDLQFGFHIR